MNAKVSVAGVVIAGGRSLRFGGEKAVALLLDEPLLARAARQLGASCPAVAVNARPDTQAATLATRLGYALLHDEAGDPDGPLSGVKAGLRWAAEQGATLLAVSPCDAPLLPAALFPRLIEAALAGRGAAFAETADGRQPLCAVWPVAALPMLTDLLTRGHPPTWRVLEDLDAERVRFDEPALFANVNTPAELEAVAARLAPGYQR